MAGRNGARVSALAWCLASVWVALWIIFVIFVVLALRFVSKEYPP